MGHLWAVVLGLVQGIAEFLPVSSSAHLALIPWAFGFQDAYPVLSSLQFDIALHAGSLIALVAALWTDWVALVRGAGARRPEQLRLLVRVHLAVEAACLAEGIPVVLNGLVLRVARLRVAGRRGRRAAGAGRRGRARRRGGRRRLCRSRR